MAMWQGESHFGPIADTPGMQRFDFTLLFSQSILAIGPSALLLLTIPVRISRLLRQNKKVSKTSRAFLKLGAYIVLGALQITLIAQFALADGHSVAQHASIATSLLGLVDALFLGGLSYLEHHRSVRPSSVILVYLFFSIAFDAVQCRTLWLLSARIPVLAAVFTTTLASKVVIFALEAAAKRSLLLKPWAALGPESTSGIVARGLFWWLNGLLIRGFSASIPLTSLWETDEQLQSRLLIQRLQTARNKTHAQSKHLLFRSVLSCLKWTLAKPVFPRLCLIAFKFSQPFLIKRVIAHVGNHRTTDSLNNGYGLVAATGLLYTGIALCTGFYQHNIFRSVTMIRGLLISLVFNETIKLSAYSTAGSGTLTLITSDVDRICGAFENLHEIWANVVELGIAIWLLELELGLGCLGPVATVIMCSIATGQIARLTGPAMKNWNAAIQERVSTTSTILASIKETKMLGMGGYWTAAIQRLRVNELNFSKRSRTLMMYMNVLGNTPAKIAPAAMFGIALLASNYGTPGRLSTSTAFASLTIVNLIVGPLAMLMYAVPDFTSSLGCFERIQAFLTEVDRNGTGQSRESLVDGELSSTPKEDVELFTARAHDSNADVISIREADFSIKAGDEPILKGIDVRISNRSFTIVAGKVGAGKTTLLRGMLGELNTRGHLKLPKVGAAYCAQTAWLVNSTIRQNILGHSHFEDQWYKTVVRACALDTDFGQLAAGDLTLVGSKGITLSGGQKQRISLARAIYSRLPVLVIDDVLNGLDRATRRHVWSQVFGPNGVLRRLGRTVILATHSRYEVDDDSIHVVVLGERGLIVCQGSFGSLKNDTHLMALLSHDQPDLKKSTDVTEEGPDDAGEDKELGPGLASENEQEETAFSGAGDTSLYGYYLRSIGWKFGVPLFLLIIAHAIMGVSSDIWLRLWTDANKSDVGVNTGKYYGIYVLIAILTLIVIGLDTWFMFVQVIPKSGQQLHYTLLRTVMRAPLLFFVANDSGDLINRFSKDMTLVDRDLPSNFWQCVGALFSTVATAGLVLQGSSYFGALVPVAVAFLYALQKFYLRTSRQLRLLDLQTSAPLYTHLLETIDGLSTIRAFGWQSATTEEALRLLDQAQKPHYLLFCVQRWLTLVLDLFVAACGVVLMTFSVVLPWSASAGSIALALVNLIGLSQLLTHVISTWTTLETSLGAIARLKSFEKSTPQEPCLTEQAREPPDVWPSSGSIQIKDITASYSTVPGSAPVLCNVSLDIRPGEKVAVCGRTGSGKSSLLLTLFRLLELNSGSIIIDGQDIRELHHDTLRQRLISIPQEATVFPGSLRSNLTAATVDNSSLQPTDEQLISILGAIE
ncbi:hypothetical protein ED733_000130 [Metarhizium rileyi]|uniref:ABC transporter, transmembrane domain, type 1 n=1 Tax=Metarhizium rileyi (strain RCEF 4871) TaxID=1649241 RepID=A0A5C6G5H0_METRR|nr:hypothetical protein ED733_000130 [Metarhizium rileyi]